MNLSDVIAHLVAPGAPLAHIESDGREITVWGKGPGSTVVIAFRNGPLRTTRIIASPENLSAIVAAIEAALSGRDPNAVQLITGINVQVQRSSDIELEHGFPVRICVFDGAEPDEILMERTVTNQFLHFARLHLHIV